MTKRILPFIASVAISAITAVQVVDGFLLKPGVAHAGTTAPIISLTLPSSIPSTWGGIGSANIGTQVQYFTKFFLGIIAFAAFIGVVYGGYLMVTSGGDTSKFALGRKNVTWSVIGMIVAILALVIVNFSINFAQGLFPAK